MREPTYGADVAESKSKITTDKLGLPMTGATVAMSIVILLEFIFFGADSKLKEAGICCLVCFVCLIVYFIWICNTLPWYIKFENEGFVLKYYTGRKVRVKYENIKSLRLMKDFKGKRYKDNDSVANWTVIVNTESGGIFEIPKQREYDMWAIVTRLRYNAERFGLNIDPICGKKSVMLAERAENAVENAMQNVPAVPDDSFDDDSFQGAAAVTFTFSLKVGLSRRLVAASKGNFSAHFLLIVIAVLIVLELALGVFLIKAGGLFISLFLIIIEVTAAYFLISLGKRNEEKYSIGCNVVFGNHLLLVDDEEFRPRNINSIVLNVAERDQTLAGRMIYEMRIKYDGFTSTRGFSLEAEGDNCEEFVTAFLMWCHENNVLGVIY